jgi:hypothetical protein
MLKIFSRNKSWQVEQQRLFFALEKIVNVALVKTERGDNQSVKDILNELETIFRKFWQLKKDNPDKFDSLLWSKDFFDKYVMPSSGREKDLTEDAPRKTKSAEELKREVSFLLSFTPGKELKGLTVFLNSFEKIWRCALRNGNDEITRYVVYHLNWLLAQLAQEPSNSLFIEQFLTLLSSITWTAIKNSKTGKEIDPSIYSASFRWYTDIIFNRLRQKERDFDLSYLEQFDRHFFSNAKYIISENQKLLFDALVQSLVDGLLIATYNEGKVWDYGHLILYSDLEKYRELDKKDAIERRIEELANSSESDLYTKEKLDLWFKKFDELKQILEPHFDPKQKEKALEVEEDIKDFAVSQFKYNNLLGIVFAISAYCLFKQKLEYIKYLWEYKQPPDSDGSWVGHDIVPNTIDSIVRLYFNKGLIERRFDFWEDHHGSERYYNEYFVLLLIRLLGKIEPRADGKYEQLEHFNLSDIDVYRLSDLEHSVDGFVRTAQGLRENKEILSALGFELNKLDDLLDRKLIPFLETLKTKAQEKIKNLQKETTVSQRKIDEFKNKVVEGFNRSAVLRDIFKNYGQYEDRTKEEFQGDLPRLGINIVDDKAAFFEEWHVHYLDWGKSYGENLAHGEDSDLLKDVSKQCQEIRGENFEQALGRFVNLPDVIIFVANIALHRYFENSESFKPKWYRDTRQLDIRGFQGWYEYKGQPIPIFETYRRGIGREILILNKSRLGKLVQYSPLDEGEKERFIKDIFYINVQAFSENPDLMDSLIKKAPEWLKNIGDEGKQREHLQERVLIHIFERFEYQISDGFEGYRMKL